MAAKEAHQAGPIAATREDVEAASAALLSLAPGGRGRPAAAKPAAHDDAAEDEALEALAAAEEAELEALAQRIAAQEAACAEVDADIAAIGVQCKQAEAVLADAAVEKIDLEAQLQQRQRVEARQQSSARLLQLQLTVATQLYGVAESLSQVAAASGSPASGWVPEALRHREREVEELRRALKRQRQLVSDAHRQLLELSTRRNPKGVGASAKEAGALRTALAEQEMARMMADARVDELTAQVRLLEEQGLRLRLHPPPLENELQQQQLK